MVCFTLPASLILYLLICILRRSRRANRTGRGKYTWMTLSFPHGPSTESNSQIHRRSKSLPIFSPTQQTMAKLYAELPGRQGNGFLERARTITVPQRMRNRRESPFPSAEGQVCAVSPRTKPSTSKTVTTPDNDNSKKYRYTIPFGTSISTTTLCAHIDEMHRPQPMFL